MPVSPALNVSYVPMGHGLRTARRRGVRRGHMCDVHGSDGQTGGRKGTVEGACGVRANGARLRARARLGGHRTGYEGRESPHGPRRSTSRDVVHDL